MLPLFWRTYGPPFHDPNDGNCMLDISSREVRDLDLFVAFFDLTGFTAFARQHDSRTVFDTLSGWYALVGGHVEGAGGHVVKFMGDAGIAVFAADETEAGVFALRTAQAEGDAWLAAQGFKAHAVTRGHVGPVTCGPLGPPGWQQFDVIGETVNTAAVASASGHYRFALTPQAFRRLSAAWRQAFKKHTPPVVYIPVELRH